MLMKRQLFLAGISLILGGMPMLAQDISSVNSVSYEWKSVPIVGGGFVDGIVFHQKLLVSVIAAPIWEEPTGGTLLPTSGRPCWTG